VARLDRVIQALFERKAQGLVLAPGKPASLLTEGAPQPLTQPLAAAHVLPFVKELVTGGDQARLEGPAPFTFAYDSPAGRVEVQVVHESDGAHVLIRPAGAAQAAASAAAPNGGAPGAGAGPSAASESARSPLRRITSAMPVGDPGARARLEDLLRQTYETGASDLHLRTGQPPILRKDGELVRQAGPELDGAQVEALILSIMPHSDQDAFRDTGDADWAHEIPGVARYRCNAALERNGPMAVFRVIPSKILTAEELGLSAEIQRLCYLTKGLVLVTGPTGSGKSTTLAAMVDLVNRTRTDHILTIEDPIEFVHPPKQCVVTQRQVGQHSKSFKSALRAALREDPDIIMVGEMRDLETISIAIETAETGHLVFGTLHTTTAASTVDRIIDQFPTDRQSQVRVMLSESLKGVISQVLCRKIGGGRVAAKEVLLAVPAISNLIREGKTFQIPSIMQTNKKAGMVTLNDALLELVEKKLVEPKEAYMKAIEKSTFAAALKAKRFDTSFLGAEA
jgi:twitching motility protein PilT